MDLDNFKEYNDTCGHAAGDEVLQRTACILTQNVRHSDLPVRLHGDEFVVFMRRAHSDDVKKLKNRLADAFEKACIPVSIGSAVECCGPGEELHFERLKVTADASMYTEKGVKKA